MVKLIAVFLYLTVLSFCDIRNMKVPSWMIWGGMACAVFEFFICEVQKEALARQIIYECIRSILPGSVLLMIAYTTKKAGEADGVLLMTLGLLYGYRRILISGCIGLCGMALVSICLLAAHKVRKETKLPCIPFLTMGQLVGMLIVPL